MNKSELRNAFHDEIFEDGVHALFLAEMIRWQTEGKGDAQRYPTAVPRVEPYVKGPCNCGARKFTDQQRDEMNALKSFLAQDLVGDREEVLREIAPRLPAHRGAAPDEEN